MIFLDECIPRDLAKRISGLLVDRPEAPIVKHLLDLYAQGIDDRTWAQLAKDNHWLPISADRGQSNRGEKLPRLFKELGLVNVSLSAKVHLLPARDKVLAIGACWLQIVDAWQNQIGCTHSLRFTDNGQGFRLVDVEKQNRKKTHPLE